MIKMIKGTYGLELPGGDVVAMNKRTGPFTIAGNPDKEAELVDLGYAEFVEDPEANPYKGKNMAELRKMAAERGVDAKAIKSKSELIAAMEAAAKEQAVELQG